MKSTFAIVIISLFLVNVAGAQSPKNKDNQPEKTSFQTAGSWKPTTDVRADIAIVYGTSDRRNMSFEERVKSWRDRGYITQFMTGIA